MSTRRLFLKRQLVFSSSLLLAPGIDSLAHAAKVININNNGNALNLLCTSNLEKLAAHRKTINNFEHSSINLFAGAINNHQALNNLLYQLDQVNYHAVNFSLAETFDIQNLANGLRGASSNFVNCNYKFNNAIIKARVKPYTIIYNGNTKIGVTGIGQSIKIPEITTKDPIASLNEIAKYLRHEQNCHQIICLADLGFDTKNKLNNLTLAQASENVALVVGAGSNPNQTTTWSYRNAIKQEVIILANKAENKHTNLLQLNTNNKQLFNFNTKNI